jgi:hypothetical protein
MSLQGKIKSLEHIYLFSMPVKEYQIVEFFLGPKLKDEVMKIMPVQKQTRAGQRTRFKVSARPQACTHPLYWFPLLRNFDSPHVKLDADRCNVLCRLLSLSATRMVTLVWASSAPRR